MVSAMVRVTQDRPYFKTMNTGKRGAALGRIVPQAPAIKGLVFDLELMGGKWQPVGESNPSFQVENLAS